MNNTKRPAHSQNATSTINTRAGQRHRDPLDYNHPYDTMRRYAELLGVRHDSARTRHSYYRAMRLLHEHFRADPATLGEDQFRDYILHIKTRKAWRPKTIRQTVACARLFFTGMLGRAEWKVFSQIRTRDHDELPAVLTRGQVTRLLGSIRLRRYRIPVKLIYCAGLRLSECLSLTVHDIVGDERKLMVRGGKGSKDRMVPLAAEMVEDLRRYWSFHRHPVLLFPNAGRGPCTPEKPARSAERAASPSIPATTAPVRNAAGRPPPGGSGANWPNASGLPTSWSRSPCPKSCAPSSSRRLPGKSMRCFSRRRPRRFPPRLPTRAGSAPSAEGSR